MKPTEEQQLIADGWRSNPNESMKVNAFAGAGKTTQLEMLGRADGRKLLYLCFNKPIQVEAERRFPRNVLCRTSHGLAYRATRMGQQQRRLDAKLWGSDVAEMFGIPDIGHHRAGLWGQWVIETVAKFCQSGDDEIQPHHATMLPRTFQQTDLFVTWARKLWARMIDPRDNVPLTHDCYLKLWQLNGASLPGDIRAAFLDEAQDSNPVLLAIMRQLGIPAVYVGDKYQSIYRFRGAINAMASLEARTFYLSQSWRFGNVVAQIAGAILAHTTEPPVMPIRGAPTVETKIVQTPTGPYTTICRRKMTLFSEAIGGDDKIHVVGGIDHILKLLEGGWRLCSGERPSDVPALARFTNYSDMETYAQEARDHELIMLDKLIKEHGSAVPRLCSQIRARHVPKEEADRTLVTGHGCKGMEWDRVRLADDFPTLDDLMECKENGVPIYDEEDRDQELHLAYVSGTRGKKELQVNDAARSFVASWRQMRAREA